MRLTAESLVIILLIGAVAGWFAGLVVQGTGFGLIGDIVIGIVGALLAGLLFPALGIHFGAGIIAQIIAATVGAVIDRKSTRLNSSHGYISYAAFCLKKK